MNTTANKPRIAITMGDPAGVGPELCLRLLADTTSTENYVPIVFGDRNVLQRVGESIGLKFDFPTIEFGSHSNLKTSFAGEITTAAGPTVAHVESIDAGAVEPGQIDARTGQASFDFIEAAILSTQQTLVDAVVTCPINKEAWDAAEINFPGHTELFAQRFNCDRFCMMMYSSTFSCSLVTTHVGYSSVPEELSTARIADVIQLSHAAIEKIENRTPSIAVLGLNPHAGENGLFGNREEQQLIVPAMKQAQQQGINSIGPLPPDTGFLPKHRDATDVYVCMYHDQGLIPFKAFNFDNGVNVTLGLPMVRTSVDHGTANDIAWQGIADPSSLYSAVNLAVKLCGESSPPTAFQ